MRRIGSLFVVFIFSFTAAAQPKGKHQGIVQDWSRRYVVYHGLTAAKAAKDPRAWAQWTARNPTPASQTGGKGHAFGKKKKLVHVDWNVSLGDPNANLGQDVYPAKYSFDINAQPDCNNDYVVYGLDVLPSNTQANVVAFNNLYVGGADQPFPTGFCEDLLTGPLDPSVYFAYQIGGGNEQINGSTTLSLDGSKIAFVTVDQFGNAYFHVLSWLPNEGTISSPAIPDVTCNTSCLATIPLGTSYGRSPYVDYATDSAYVTSGDGNVYKINNVFNGTPTLAIADPNWPTSGFCTSSGTGFQGLNPGVFAAGNLYFTDAAGGFHIVTGGAGQSCNDSYRPLVGGSSLTGTFIDTPLVNIPDGNPGSVFLFGRVTDAFSDSSNVYQMTMDGAPLATLGFINVGNSVPPEAGTFDNTYYSDPLASTGFLYFAVSDGQNGGTNGSRLFRIKFDNSITISPTFDAVLPISTQPDVALSELVEIYNPNTSGTKDKLFVLGGSNCGTKDPTMGCVLSFDISAGATFQNLATVDEPANNVMYPGGIVVDNVSNASQAASIYFAVPGKAVKLEQAGLQ